MPFGSAIKRHEEITTLLTTILSSPPPPQMELLKNRMFSVVLLLLLLFLSSGTTTCTAARPEGLPGVSDEKRTCESQSHKFKGLCFSQSNCGHVCRTEGFQFGKCRGVRRRCFCTKYC